MRPVLGLLSDGPAFRAEETHAETMIPMERVYDSQLVSGATAIGSFGSVNSTKRSKLRSTLIPKSIRVSRKLANGSQKSIANEMSLVVSGP